jgi:hypothetical protein
VKRFALLSFIALILPLGLRGQSYTLTQISAQHLYDTARQPLNGTIVVTLTDSTDTPVTYTPQGGSPSTATFTANVKNGAIQLIAGFQPFTVPAAATTSPAGIVYRIQTKDQTSTVVWTFPKTAIAQPYYSLDGYIAQADIPISGSGAPSVPHCAGGAQYTDTTAATVPWACTILTQPDNSTVWTQSPSQAAQCPGMAIAYPLIGNPYCMSPAQAYLLPGYVLGNSSARPSMAQPIIPPGGGGGSAPAPPAYAVQIANPTASALAADPYITINPTAHIFGVGTGQVPGQLSVNGGCVGTCATLTSADGVTWAMGQNLSVAGSINGVAAAFSGALTASTATLSGSLVGASANFSGDIRGATAQAAIRDNGGQVFNCLVFGADPTGATDSSTAINLALSTAQGKLVYCPAGTYKLQSSLVHPTNIYGTAGAKIQGDGPAMTIFQCTAPFTGTSCVDFVGVDPTHPNIYADGGWIRDIGFTTSGSPAGLNAIAVTGQWNFVVEHNDIVGFAGDALKWPLRLDISTNPDIYASLNNHIANNIISNNGGAGIDQECGLCAGVHMIVGNRIGVNAKDGMFIAAHGTTIISNTVFSNGSGTAGSTNVPLSQCVAGGIHLARVQTGPIGTVIKGNSDFDSNCLYQILVDNASALDISTNRFISHGKGAVWPQTQQNIPAVMVKFGFAANTVSGVNLVGNYERSDSIVAGVPDAGVDSALTMFQFDFFNVHPANVFLNVYSQATGNITPYARGGGAVITCTGTGTPACVVQQGGFYISTPAAAVPTGFGCSGTPTVALTANVVTSIDMSPVTGCTSAISYLIVTPTVYPTSNTFGVYINDGNGVFSAPPTVSTQTTLTNGGSSVTSWNSGNGLRWEQGTTPNTFNRHHDELAGITTPMEPTPQACASTKPAARPTS